MNAQYDRFSDALVSLVKTWRAALDARLKPFGQSQARWQVLLKLLRANQPLAQCELAMRIGIEPASLVRLLDALQQEGLIVRDADPDDRRSKLVSLTTEGARLSRELGVIADQLRSELLGAADEAQLQACTALLEQLRHTLEQSGSPE
jgi:MarR family transcriptional regulator for hemolysin